MTLVGVSGRVLPLIPFLAVVCVTLPTAATPRTPACGEAITGVVVLDADLVCSGDGLVIESDDVVLDCADHVIRGAVVADTAGVRVSGAARATVRRCTISGFTSGVRAALSDDLTVEANLIADNTANGLTVLDGARPRVLSNQFERQQFQITLNRTSEPHVVANAFVSAPRGNALSVMSSPGPVIALNRFVGGGTIFVAYAGSGGAEVENNDLGAGDTAISVVDTDGCRVAGNSLAGESGRGSVRGISLIGTRACEALDNRIIGPGGWGLIVDSGQNLGHPGAIENVIRDNDIRGVGIGINVLGGVGNVFSDNRLLDVEWGVGVFEGGAGGNVGRSRKNRLEHNDIRARAVGLYVVDGEENVARGNVVAGAEIGVWDLRMSTAPLLPNTIDSNSVVENGLFGLLVWGSSPVVILNKFERNGLSTAPPSAELASLPSFLDESRAAITVVPFAGTADTLDDGDPADDAVPRLDSDRRVTNTLVENATPAVRWLDAAATRGKFPAISGVVSRDAALRQEWFGAIRVVDAAGDPVAGARVQAFDANGEVAGEWVSDDDGVAPPGVDLARPQGLSPLEPGGPRSAWARFAQYQIGFGGRLVLLTPHRLVATSGTSNGCAFFGFDGLPRPGETSPDGRYQMATVRLGNACEGQSCLLRWSDLAGSGHNDSFAKGAAGGTWLPVLLLSVRPREAGCAMSLPTTPR